jgi:hypothetical protein
MSFPNRGKSFPKSNGHTKSGGPNKASTEFAHAMSVVLHRAFDGSVSKTKTVARLTGANERTVKNWFRGLYGPSGHYLVMLAQHSDEVFAAFLMLAGRYDALKSQEITNLEERLIVLLGRRRKRHPAS